MALTTLDSKPALVVTDLQNGITAGPAVHPLDDVIQRPAGLDRRRTTAGPRHSRRATPQ